ncbi:serine/threonine-protein kinase [Stieleria marina]
MRSDKSNRQSDHHELPSTETEALVGDTTQSEDPHQTVASKRRQASRKTPHQAAERLGEYEVVCKLGKGGFADVYEVRPPGTDMRETTTALKVGRATLNSNETLAKRFARETDLLDQARDIPGLVRMRGFGVFDDGKPYIEMDLMHGGSLAEFLKSPVNVVEPTQVVDLLVALAKTLTRLNEIGIVHRDIKPANLLSATKGFDLADTVLADFGISADLFNSRRLTQTNQFLGTRAYAAPEQFTDSKRVDVRTDIYACGMVMYELLTRRPFRILGNGSIPASEISKCAPAPSDFPDEVPVSLRYICRNCLQPIPDRRCQDPNELVRDLKENAF